MGLRVTCVIQPWTAALIGVTDLVLSLWSEEPSLRGWKLAGFCAGFATGETP